MSKRCLGCMELFRDDLQVCPYCGHVVGTHAEEAIHMDPGTLLHNRYIVGRVLGFGGFGVTYIGWDGKLQQKVAIKEYLPSEFSTRMPGCSAILVLNGDKGEQFHDGMKKFVEEARHLAKFQSEPGIVRVFDSFEENDTAYIIMEYLEGETLSKYLERVGTIPENEAVELLRPVMKSLEAVHAEGLIHRDIAPDNIFLTTKGEAKLIDFGASRYATVSHSRSLTVIVKPGYSPEEQYRSRSDQGPHTDVYSLAGTLYKMITGKTPPDALERRTQYETKNRDMLIPPHKLNKHISVNREVAILNAMNVRIEDRTPNILAFMKELDANPPAKRIYGKIKKLNFYMMPLWAKITVPIALVCLMIFSGLMLTGVIDFSNFSEELVIPQGICIVPDVEGFQQDEAVKMIEREHLQVKTAGTVESEYIPAGKIVLQDPMGGSYLKKNGAVHLTVSSGKQVVFGTMPHLIWDSLEDAREKLKSAGLGEPVIKEAFDENVSLGHIIAQSISAGEQVEEGTIVELIVSKGPASFKLADVKNMELEDAQELLSAQGLLVTVEYEKNDKVAENKIISQNIAAGTDVKRGDEIKLKVSSGRETIDVVKVIDKPLEEAKKTLEKQGFTVKSLENYDDKVPAGCVISQDPGAGTKQLPGTEIILYVSKGAKPRGTAVADVIGMSSDNAKKTLEKQGFYVEIYLDHNSYVPAGTVYAQTPDAGVSKMPGATITIYVSRGEEIKTISVPNVLGLSLADAQERLISQDFQVKVYENYNSTVPEGQVYDQSPAAGAEKMPGATVEIYISKGGQPVSVSFDGNGGSVDSPSIVVRLGETYGELPAASRIGYTFTGWYLTPDGGSRVTSSTVVDNPSGHTLYAGWQIHSHTLNFDANGGSGNSSVTLNYGNTYGELPTPTREHYSFEGWYTEPSGGSQVSASTTIGDGDVTVYAHWSIVPYTVSWENGSHCTITVERTSSPNAGAGTGKLSSGSMVYYGDVLEVSYQAADGYTMADSGAKSITVSGNVGSTQIYGSAKPSNVTYRLIYRSVNGTSLGSEEVTHEYGSTHTVSAPDKAGYHTPAAQSVTWDSNSGKEIVFQYEPVVVTNETQSGTLTDYNESNGEDPTVWYSVMFEYRNRTADSVEVRVTVSETIKKNHFCYNVHRARFTADGYAVEDIIVVDDNVWGGERQPQRTETGTTSWVRIPVGTTNAVSMSLNAYFYDADGNGNEVSSDRKNSCAPQNLTWNFNIPAY